MNSGIAVPSKRGLSAPPITPFATVCGVSPEDIFEQKKRGAV